jgi:hypothetical protein
MTAGVSRRAALGMGVATAAFPAAAADREGLEPQTLRVEWRVDPIGVDAARPRFTWTLRAAEGRRGARQIARRVIVASSLAALAARRGDVWDSGRVRSGKFAARPGRALNLTSHMPYVWAVMVEDEHGAVRWSPPARFVTGVMDEAEWNAAWIAARPDPPRAPHARGQSRIVSAEPDDTQLPLMRKDFTTPKRPVRAIVSAAGLGHFELTVNGRAATQAVFEPGWSEYTKTILYATYDVTDLLAAGANRLGVRLGGGMFSVQKVASRKAKFTDNFGAPKLILRLTLAYADGRIEHVVSDAGWTTAPGPILYASMFAGEDVDARLEVPGWDRPGETAGRWSPVLVTSGPGGRLKAQATEPVMPQKTFTPRAVTEPRPGVFVYDLGENFAGRPRIVVRGEAGSALRILPSEVLDEAGLAWQHSFNAGKTENGRREKDVYYSYILAGLGDETFVPRFNYQGFRYLQVERTPAREGGPLPRAMSVAGEFLSANLATVGRFDCSKRLFVQIHELIERAVVSNAYSVLTDCPHREKLGWLEQTHLNALTAFYNRDGAALYEKTIHDIVDSQKADGMVPGIAPEFVAFVKADGSDEDARNSPEWGSAVVLSAWAAYRNYGDETLLADGYPAMRAYVDYLASRADGHIVDFGLGDWYDVGPGPLGASQLTSRALTGTATWHQALATLSKIAATLGRPKAEVDDYAARARAVGEAFNRRFFDPARGLYDRGSQTANPMPLALGLVPADREEEVLAALVRAVRESANGVTAGDVGFHYVVRALTLYGRDDVLFDMMSVTDRPSYGYQIAKGATALAESWSADPTKSLNHFMLGHGEGWLFGGLAGVNIDFSAAPERVLTLWPRPVGDIASASARYQTTLGEVACAWRREGGRLTMEVEVPAGATSTVIVPTPRPDQVLEGGRPVVAATGVRVARRIAAGLELVAGSGRYRFEAPSPV